MMRLTLLLTLVSAVVPGPASAEQVEPVVLTQWNTVKGKGPVAIDVTLPAPATLDVASVPPLEYGWAEIQTDGSFAAVLLVSKTETMPDGVTPVHAFQIRQRGGHGCPSFNQSLGLARCLSPFDHTYMQTPTPPEPDTPFGDRYAFKPGEYTLYLITNPGKTASAFIALRQLGGDGVTMTATRPVTAEHDFAHATDRAFASLIGSHSRVVERKGLVVFGASFSNSQTPKAGPVAYAECLTRGSPGPTSPHDCYPATKLGQDVTVAGQPVIVRPQNEVNSSGMATAEGALLTTLEGPILSPGLWTNTFRVQRGSDGPGVSAFAFWLELD